jgi:hypothetical protein
MKASFRIVKVYLAHTGGGRDPRITGRGSPANEQGESDTKADHKTPDPNGCDKPELPRSLLTPSRAGAGNRSQETCCKSPKKLSLRVIAT